MSSSLALVPIVTVRVSGQTAPVFLPTFTLDAVPNPFPAGTTAPVTHAWDTNCNDLLLTSAVAGIAAVNTIAATSAGGGNALNVNFAINPQGVLAYSLSQAPFSDSSPAANLTMPNGTSGVLTTAKAAYPLVSATYAITGLATTGYNAMPCLVPANLAAGAAAAAAAAT